MNSFYAAVSPVVFAIPVLVVLALVVLVASARRRQNGGGTGILSRETRKKDVGNAPLVNKPARRLGREIERIADLERRGVSLEPVNRAVKPYEQLDPEALGVTRRQFFNRGILAFFILGLSGFGTAVLAYLWPVPKGGFGSKIRVGSIDDIKAKISAGNGFYYVAEGRMWITSYPTSALEKGKAVYGTTSSWPGQEAGVMALYQKCPHLGCRVPSCASSKWFECGCHGSQYNLVGEKKGGPAPRGMDRFAMSVDGGALIVDTGTIIQGPPIGTNTTGQEAEGPHCVGGSGGH